MELPGEKLVIRLWETIEKSGTGLFKPWQLRRVGIAEAEVASKRLILVAAAENKIQALGKENSSSTPLIGLSKNSSETPQDLQIEPSFCVDALLEISEKSRSVEHLRKEVNIESAISHAEYALRNQSADSPTEEIDMDWFFRWREYVGGMSADELRQIWGNLLAGEVMSPGRFDYRTLDFLRSLSSVEAKLIEKLSGFVVEGFKVIHAKSAKRIALGEPISNGLRHGELLALEELGILGGVSSMGYVSKETPFCISEGKHAHIFACRGRGVTATTQDAAKTTGLGFYRLTKLGLNVLRLVEAVPNEAYLQELAQALLSDGFEVEIGDVLLNSDNTRRFENSMKIEIASTAHSS